MKINVHAHYHQYRWEEKPIVRISNFRLCGSDSDVVNTYLGEFEIDIPVSIPDRAEIVGQQVEAIRREQAKHQAAITSLEHKIQELLCIEYKPETEES